MIFCDFNKLLYLSHDFLKKPKDLLIKFIGENTSTKEKKFIGFIKLDAKLISKHFLVDKNFCSEYYENLNQCLPLLNGYLEVKDIKDQTVCFASLSIILGKSTDVIKEMSLKKDQNFNLFHLKEINDIDQIQPISVTQNLKSKVTKFNSPII